MEDTPEPKPNPDIFLLAADRINTDPKDCLVFEDSIFGIRAAKDAGMKVIALATTHSRELLETEHPDLIINDFTYLININYPQFEER
jgi:beta-phosphoglucomutase-like phosphatase (HAD superfamily)